VKDSEQWSSFGHWFVCEPHIYIYIYIIIYTHVQALQKILEMLSWLRFCLGHVMWSLSFNIIASKIPFHEHTILLQAKWAPHVCSFSLVLSCCFLPFGELFAGHGSCIYPGRWEKLAFTTTLCNFMQQFFRALFELNLLYINLCTVRW